MMKAMTTSIAILLIGGAIAAVVVLNTTEESNEGQAESIDDMIKYSYESPEITTDLEDGSFVRVQFQILTDSDKAKEEIGKREFQLKNILIKELATTTEEDFKSGLSELEDTIRTRLNELMVEGKITDVYTIHKILQ
ncbi:flagellar basal body-associated protein FliL [Virgibacillus ainsalahensis]